jgi:L-ascorbate metabolism protein UlaG (beta-lactamase superfamily)
MHSLAVYPLGQVGYLFEKNGARILIDPYLTDSVADNFGAALRRRFAPTLSAGALVDVDWVLLTHAHMDHADAASLASIRASSPRARFLCAYEAEPIVLAAGVPPLQVTRASGQVVPGAGGVVFHTIPAAHTALERNAANELRYVGFLLQWDDLTIYHAGDTIPHAEIFSALAGRLIDYAFLPVNERNYFRDAAGIVGNMSAREAFEFARVIGARTLIPTHWDLFEPNGAFPWEVEALHQALNPPFALRFLPCGAVYRL